MNIQFLNNPSAYKAWLDGLKTTIYFMTEEQLAQFKAVVNMSTERKDSPEKMQADYDSYKDGSFVQIEGVAENVVMEGDNEAISA